MAGRLLGLSILFKCSFECWILSVILYVQSILGIHNTIFKPGFILDLLFELSVGVLLVGELGQLAIKPQGLHTLPMFARFSQIKFSTNAIHFGLLPLDQLMQPYINTRLLNFVLTNLLTEPSHNNTPFSLDQL